MYKKKLNYDAKQTAAAVYWGKPMHNNAPYEDLKFAYVQRWGNHASIPLVERPCALYIPDGIDGVIGYHERKKSRIVFGDPLCNDSNKNLLLESFEDHCRSNKYSALYLNASESFAQYFTQRYSGTVISLGNELIINPQRDLKKETGFYARDLRWKHKKSVRAGISVHEYRGNDLELEQKIEKIGQQWLAQRSGRQACLFSLNLFKNRRGKRWFYAQQQDAIIGILTINEIPAHKGWVMNMLMCTPTAVNSTSAFMLMQVFDVLSSEGCEFFSAGFIPDNQLNKIQGFGAISSWLAHKSYKFCSKLLKLQSKKQFWNQFEPVEKPTYLLSSSSWRLRDFAALMQALHVIK